MEGDVMPIQECELEGGGKGYRYGESGKCYADRADAVKQAMAIKWREGTYRVTKGHHSTGVMVSIKLPEHVAKAAGAKHPNAEAKDDMHVTLAYLGKLDKLKDGQVQKAADIVRDVSASFDPLKGRLGGHGRFNASESSDGKDVIYANFDAPGLEELRQAIVDELTAAGLPVNRKHGFTPHVTMAYVEPGEPTPEVEMPADEFDIDELSMNIGPDALDFPLGEEEPEGEPDPADFQEIPASDMIALKTMGINVVQKEEDWVCTDVKIVAKEDAQGEHLVYGVVYEPNAAFDSEGNVIQINVEDSDDEVMTEEDVQFSAHYFMTVKGIMAFRHCKVACATVVESYIAPCDFQIGEQTVKKGSWVLVTRIDDPMLWSQIESGQINAYSVGGFSKGEPLD